MMMTISRPRDQESFGTGVNFPELITMSADHTHIHIKFGIYVLILSAILLYHAAVLF